MLILRPTRTTQPAQPSGVEWANPLTSGLIVAVSGAKPVELVSGVALRSEGGPTMVGAPPGMAGPRFNGSSGVLWAPIPRIALGNWTLLQVVRGNSPGTDRRSFNVGNSANNAVIVAIGTGAANAAKVRAVGVNDFGTAPADTGQVSSADAFVSTGPRVVGLRYNRESGYQCFVNGAPDGFSPFVEPSSTYTVDRVGVGALYRTGAAAFFAGDSFGAFAWARALSNEEVAEASRNPWQLFAPEPRRIWIAASGPANDTTLAASGNVAVTGNANLTTALRLAATPSASVTGAANLTTAVRLAATPSASVTGAANLTTAIRLAAAGTVSVTGTAALTTGDTLSASGTASVTGTANLTTAIRLAATPSVSVTGTANLQTAPSGLEAQATASVTGTANLTTSIRLAATPSASATGAADLTTSIRLAATPAVSVTGTADLLTGAGTLAASGTVTFTAVGALLTQIRLQALASVGVTGTANLDTNPLVAGIGDTYMLLAADDRRMLVPLDDTKSLVGLDDGGMDVSPTINP